MTIKQCDKCQKVIDYKDRVRIQFGLIYNTIELCIVCAQPIIEVLKAYETYDNSWVKNLPIANKAL
jgi:hypothetical protein